MQRRPKTIATVAALTMLLIAAPATALRLGSSDASNDPAGQTTHRAYELLAQGFGEGFNGPLLVVAKLPPGGGSASVGTGSGRDCRDPRRRGRRTRQVQPGRQRGHDHRLPELHLRRRLRRPNSSPACAKTSCRRSPRARGLTVYVGGVTAGSVDFANTLGHKLPLFIGVVVLLSALLLMVVFRSLVIPLQAAFMNLLSIGAALGVIVVVFQWGWLGNVTGIQPGPIEAFIPVLLFAIVFGLSMDYEVFLISRMHERWTQTHDSKQAVGEGLALTGRVVTAAAAIMICVFLSFMLGDNRVIKEFGLSLASAVFLDAVIERCLLLQAVLTLLGARTWQIPAWLDRTLPHLNIEGTAVPVTVAAPREDSEDGDQEDRDPRRRDVVSGGVEG